MAERIVYMRVGNQRRAVPFFLRTDGDWIHVRPVPGSERADACRILNHLHLQYDILNIPHRPALDRDEAGLEYIDAISVPSTLAEQYLFPKIIGLADSADAKSGIH